MSNPRSLADFTISRIAARSESPGFTVVLLMLLAREFTPSTFPVITGPSWLTHVSRSASYTVPGIDPILCVWGRVAGLGVGSPGWGRGGGRGGVPRSVR